MTTTELLADIPLDLARRAHAGTSFVPDQRADQERASYAATLAADYAAMAEIADTAEKRATLDAEFARYREGFRRRYLVMLGSKAACVSVMIAGPSNFPGRRAQKRSDAADRRTADLLDYRDRALPAIRRALRPEDAPIMAGDADAVERLRAKIAKAEAAQAQMKACNAAIRKHAKAGPDAQVAALVTLGIPGLGETRARDLLKPDFCGRVGFADYEIKNNGANIRAMQKRLEQIARAKTEAPTEVRGERATVEDAPADNRVRVYFSGKPDAAVRDRLKAAGFRWAPSLGCWQAYRNHHAAAVARDVAGAGEV